MKGILLTIIVAVATACAGDTGNSSPIDGTGTADLIGPQGPQGNVGPQGDIGPAGPEGQSGTTGTQGPQGLQGDTGLTGIQGEQGIQGQQGATGLIGASGQQGLAGSPGVDGATGQQGASGTNAASLILVDSNGQQLGYPITVDAGGSLELGFYAHQENPAATFPEGELLAINPTSFILYSLPNCTGVAYVRGQDASTVFEVNRRLRLTALWFVSTGTISHRTVRSSNTQGSCVNTGTLSVSTQVATEAAFSLSIATPLTAMAL